jgi:hypothetical protein
VRRMYKSFGVKGLSVFFTFYCFIYYSSGFRQLVGSQTDVGVSEERVASIFRTELY